MAKSKKGADLPQKVTLKRLANDTFHEFQMAHALNLLRMQKTSAVKGWEISDDNYEFDGNEIHKRADS